MRKPYPFTSCNLLLNTFTSIGEVDFLFHLQEKPAKPDYDPGDQQPNTENPPYRYAQGDKEQVILDYGVRDGQVVVQQFGILPAYLSLTHLVNHQCSSICQADNITDKPEKSSACRQSEEPQQRLDGLGEFCSQVVLLQKLVENIQGGDDCKDQQRHLERSLQPEEQYVGDRGHCLGIYLDEKRHPHVGGKN